MRIYPALLVLLVLGCKSPSDDPDDTDTDVQQTGDTGPPTEPPPIVDCSSFPAGPFTIDVLEAPRAYHGIGFDDTGGLVGWDGTSLIRATSPTEASLWVPNVPFVEQIEFHPNGDLIVAGGNNGGIVAVAPDGSTNGLANGIYAYGLEIGPDGAIYTANQQNVRRVTVEGGSDQFLGANVVSVPKVLNFSPDQSKMYIGTNSSNGEVYEIDLDEDLNPLPPARLLATTPGTWHDGLAVDACGNLYVAEYVTAGLYRITPEGEVSTLVDSGNTGAFNYGHGAVFGSGIGEWSDHSIYVPLPYGNNQVGEIVLGVPGREFNGGYYEVVR